MVENRETLQSKSCDWCSGGSFLDIRPGKFRDFDSDLSYGIPVCGGCGGLGVQYEIEDYKERTRRICDLRFKYCPTDPSEREKLTTTDKLANLIALEAEVKDLVSIYGAKEDSFANEINEGCLLPKIEELHELAKIIEQIRNTPSDEIKEDLKEPSIAYVEGRNKAADKGFKEAIKKHPDSSFPEHDYAVFLAEGLENYEEAAKHFIRSTYLEPKKSLHFFSAAKCLTTIGRISEAILYLKEMKSQGDFSEFVANNEVNVDETIKILEIALIEKKSRAN